MATHPHLAAIFVSTLLFLAGSVASVEAQTTGGRTSTTGPGSGDGTTSGRILLYGSPENCPPTRACEQRPPRKVVTPGACDRWEYVRTSSGRRIRRCVVN